MLVSVANDLMMVYVLYHLPKLSRHLHPSSTPTNLENLSISYAWPQMPAKDHDVTATTARRTTQFHLHPGIKHKRRTCRKKEANFSLSWQILRNSRRFTILRDISSSPFSSGQGRIACAQASSAARPTSNIAGELHTRSLSVTSMLASLFPVGNLRQSLDSAFRSSRT